MVVGNFKLESFEKELLGGDNPKASSYDGKTFSNNMINGCN